MNSVQHHWSLGEPQVKRVQPFVALAAAARLTVPQIPIFAERATTDLMRLADAHRLAISAAPVFIYTGMGAGANDLFLLQIALPVADDAAADVPEPFAMKQFDAFHCFAVDYHGPMQHISQAYAPTLNALHDAGHTPIEQSREVYKHWIAYDAADNTTEIQLGIV